MAGNRKEIPAATQAALWVLSSGRCYFPGCSSPVVVEVQPGVYRKNAQIAHIFGVEPEAPRHNPDLAPRVRDSFANLLLMCLAHHAEVDDKQTGAERYPPKLLLAWKRKHEGANGSLLKGLRPITEETLTWLLTNTFTPPIERLQEIADQLADTGTLTAATVAELQQVVAVIANTGPDSTSVKQLAWAAEIYGRSSFRENAKVLGYAAERLPAAERSLAAMINQLNGAVNELRRLSHRR